jgi:hypothetical protein
MKTAPKTIRTEADARAYLEAEGLGLPYGKETKTANGETAFIQPAPCGRCGGSGFVTYGNIDGRRCFACGGANTSNRTRTVTLKGAAQRIKAERTRAAKKAAERKAAKERQLEGQRNYNESKGLGRITFEEADELRAQERREAAAALTWVGTEGKREDFTVKLEKVVGPFASAYGDRYLSIMTEAGTENKLVWWNRLEAEEGETVKVKATVKAHDMREGVRQTVLTRVKVLG